MNTVKVLRLDKPGPSLAVWLAAHHPELFLAMYSQARAAQTARNIQLNGLRGLGDDGVTTELNNPSVDDSLDTVTLSTNMTPEALPPNLLTDSNSAGSGFLSSIGSALGSVGSTLGSAVGSTFSALGSVGSFLSSKTGLTSLTGIAQSYFNAQGATATAQTQAAVLQAQAQRAATQQTAAPITYQRDAYGNVVPVYATRTPQGTVYQPLSAQGIASLTPSSFSVFLSQYGLWLGLGALALVGFAAMRR